LEIVPPPALSALQLAEFGPAPAANAPAAVAFHLSLPQALERTDTDWNRTTNLADDLLQTMQLVEFVLNRPSPAAKSAPGNHVDSPSYIEVKGPLDALSVDQVSALGKPDEPRSKAEDDEKRTAQTPDLEHDPRLGCDLDSAQLKHRETRPKMPEVEVWQNQESERRGENVALLDPPTGAGRSRISGFAPLLVSVVLGVLITMELARASLILLGDSSSMAREPALVLNAPKQRAIDVHGIVAAHLFGVFVDDSSTQDPAKAPRTSANLLLAGTLATDDPKHGFAIISDGGRATVYRVGDSVADGALHYVYRDRVVLKRRGSLETLVLPRLPLAKGKSDGQLAPAPRTAEGEQARNLRQMGSPSAGDVLQGTGSAGPDGKLRGFRVFPARNRRIFMASGLRSGDLIVAVNGASLEAQDRKTGQEIFDSMKTSSQATVTVDRAGERYEVTINAAQPDPSEESDATDQ
jgi:general secretion pathway protein C